MNTEMRTSSATFDELRYCCTGDEIAEWFRQWFPVHEYGVSRLYAHTAFIVRIWDSATVTNDALRKVKECRRFLDAFGLSLQSEVHSNGVYSMVMEPEVFLTWYIHNV
jgi:hypothetical protein